MAVLLKVGNYSEFTRPPENFPRCGDFYNANVQALSSDDLSSSKNKTNVESSSISSIIISTEDSVSNAFTDFWKMIENLFSKNGSSSSYSGNNSYFMLIILCIFRYV